MIPRNIGLARRGSTSHLLPLFAGSLLVATVIDLLGAVLGMAVAPDGNSGAALTLVTTFSRPGLSTVVFVAVLVVAFLRSRAVDQDHEPADEPTPVPARSTPAGLVAAWIAIVGGGTLAVLAIWFGALLWIDGHGQEFSDNPSDLEINLIVGGITAIGVLLSVIPVWLGLCVLKRRAWARYSLIAYGAAAVAAVQMWPLMQKEPLIGWGALAVPVLLIWSELRPDLHK